MFFLKATGKKIMISSLELLLSSSSWVLLFSSIGFLFLFKHSISLLKWAFISFLRQPKDLKKYGSWALVTGSTDGIGKAFAFQLARTGLNLVLVSRNPEKLEAVTAEIRQTFPETRIRTVAVDFSREVLSGVREVEAAVEGLDVGVLINNVGITYPSAMFFHETREEVWTDVVRVNLEGTTRVTRAVLAGMVERKRGAIVNIGSGAAIVVPSHPLYAIYAATKAYVDQLSRSLHVEYKSFGIDVQCQVPLYVATKMCSRLTSTEKPTMFTPTAEDYTAAAIRQVGYEPRCSPYWAHSIQWFVAKLVPVAILNAWRLSIGIHRRARSQLAAQCLVHG